MVVFPLAFWGGDIPDEIINPYASWIDLDGVSDYINTPDSVANSVTGSLDIIVKVAANDWSPITEQGFIAKYVFATANRAYSFSLATSGIIYLTLSDTGSAPETILSSIGTGAANGTTLWLRVTYNVSTATAQFFTATTVGYPQPEDWSQLGTDITSSSKTTIFDSTAPVTIGALGDGSTFAFDGKIYYAEIRDGIDGTVVAQFNASLGSDPTYDNVDGETDWTNNGGTPGSD